MGTRVFVSGATGFIGSQLSQRLADGGQIVHALYRSSKKADILKHGNIRFFKGDICDRSSLEAAMAGCAEVYHLGAFARIWHKDPTHFRKINVDGTANVCDAALKNGITKVVITSTAGVFGPSLSEPVDEQSQRTEDFFTPYEISKSEMEAKALEYIDKGLKVVLVNPTRVFGPGLLSEANSATKIIRAYLKGRWRILPGKGQYIGNYAFIEDVVEGHRLAMIKGLAGERYILGGTNLSFADLFRVVSETSGMVHRMVCLPAPLMKSAAGLLFFVSRVMGKPPRISPRWVGRFLRNWAVSIKKAENDLGYRITPIEVAMKKTVQWLRATDI